MGNILCSKPKPVTTKPGQPALLTRTINSSNKLAFQIYHELRKGSEGNILLSPSGITMSISMLHSCAKDTTATEIYESCLFTDMEESEISGGAKQLDIFLSTEKNGSIFDTSNRIFVKKGKKPTKKFIKDTTHHYNCTPKILDFASSIESCRKEVNKTVGSDANGSFTNFLREESNPLSQETSVFATNALYFKGKWNKEFDKEQTEMSKFKTNKGLEVDVEMMYGLLETGHATNNELDCRIIAVPYVKEEMSMYVILPNQENGLPKLESRLDSERLGALIMETTANKQHILFKLPKFKLGGELGMKKMLQSFGMRKAFSEEEADLSKITGKKLHLTEVQHKVLVEVCEEGKPYVAPGDGQMGECSPTEFLSVLQITVDHPFLFCIRDNRTHAIYAMGRVVDPKAGE